MSHHLTWVCVWVTLLCWDVSSDDELLMLTNDGELSDASLGCGGCSVKSNSNCSGCHDDHWAFSSCPCEAVSSRLSTGWDSLDDIRLIRLLNWRTRSSFCCLYAEHSLRDSAYSSSSSSTTYTHVSPRQSASKQAGRQIGSCAATRPASNCNSVDYWQFSLGGRVTPNAPSSPRVLSWMSWFCNTVFYDSVCLKGPNRQLIEASDFEQQDFILKSAEYPNYPS